jgi:pyruvate ferredoxin oxidoreductase beta subunit
MTRQPIKFYQTGSFAIGNRLVPVGDRSVQSDTHRTNSLTSGHRACQGAARPLGRAMPSMPRCAPPTTR